MERSRAFVVIDMQNDFITGSLGSREAEAMAPRLLSRLEREAAAGADLFFTMDTHGADYLATQEGRRLPVAHCIKGTEGWALWAPLSPFAARAKAVVWKGAFGSLDLAERLEGYGEIVLAGLCTDICVVSNALIVKAAHPEAQVAVVASCCAGVSPQSHEAALAVMRTCQVDVED